MLEKHILFMSICLRILTNVFWLNGEAISISNGLFNALFLMLVHCLTFLDWSATLAIKIFFSVFEIEFIFQFEYYLI